MKIEGGDHIQLRDGTALVGEVKNEALSIKPTFTTKPIEVERGRIVWVLMGNEKGVPEDQMMLLDGSELRGAIIDQVIKFDSKDTGPIDVALEHVLAIQLLMELV